MHFLSLALLLLAGHLPAPVQVAALPQQAQAVLSAKRLQCPQAPSTPLFRRVDTESEHYMYTTTTSPSFASSRASSLADSDYEAALNAHESTFAFNARESTFEADGVAARVFGAPQPGTVPLYHVAHPGTQDHFYTRDVRERDAKLVPSAAPQRANARRGLGPADGGAALRTGYIDAGVAAWVFARRVCGAVPLFRVYNPVIGAHFYTTDVVERDEKVRDDGYGEGVIAGFVIPA